MTSPGVDLCEYTNANPMPPTHEVVPWRCSEQWSRASQRISRRSLSYCGADSGCQLEGGEVAGAQARGRQAGRQEGKCRKTTTDTAAEGQSPITHHSERRTCWLSRLGMCPCETCMYTHVRASVCACVPCVHARACEAHWSLPCPADLRGPSVEGHHRGAASKAHVLLLLRTRRVRHLEREGRRGEGEWRGRREGTEHEREGWG